MIEMIREGLNGEISGDAALAIAVTVTLFIFLVFVRSRRKSEGLPHAHTLLPLLWPWLAMSMLWIVGVFYAESIDGLLAQELGEVLSTALVPPVLPPLILGGFMRVLADVSRP